MNAAGVISGTPTTACTASPTFTVTNAAAATASKSLSITINTATINGAALYATDCAGCHGPLATSSKGVELQLKFRQQLTATPEV
ncbi:cytochrome c [Pelotalea chapellei]|uniref:Cytochrome c domain-containing protein n=1 Tax=Pelotalea chapellei TaxID=44671 RepID=A0ABS5UA93_9BACT|nr:hypothetical protein [Pelotalea chapellei]